MTASVPAVRSLLTRARTTLAETSEARQLTCADVQIQLGEAALNGAKVPRPIRRHLHDCEACCAYRDQLGVDARALAAFSPIGFLIAAKELLLSKLGGGAGAVGGGSTAAAGAAGAGGGLVSGLGAAGWATNAKVAAATLAVAVAAGGAGQAVSPADPGQLQRISPVLKTAPNPSPAAVNADSIPQESPSTEAVPGPTRWSSPSEAPDSTVDAGSTSEPWRAGPETEPDATAPGNPWEQADSTLASPAATDESFRP
jgi:hypothetical protein